MEKRLIVLGLLLHGRLSGYRLHQIAESHSEVYRGLKKANVYYLLARLETEGLVALTVEPAARGPRRERLVYAITSSGRREFRRLLREVLREYEPTLLSVEAASVLLHHVPAAEAASILERREAAVVEHRRRVVAQLSTAPGSAGDLLLALIDAELGWLGRAREGLAGRGPSAERPTPEVERPLEVVL